MSLLLPATRQPSSAVPRPYTFSGNQESTLGGPSTPVIRMGDRLALDMVITRMTHAEAAIWLSVLMRAISEDARAPFPQPGITIGTPGAATIDGAGQTGSSLALKTMTAGYVVRQGQWFHILQGGKRYLHHATAPGTVDGAGKVVLSIWPMLRIVTVNSSPCDFVAPQIEGQLIGAEAGIPLVRARAESIKLSIVERE